MTDNGKASGPAARLPSAVVVPRLVEAATNLLAAVGPSEIKARSVAEAAGLSKGGVLPHRRDARTAQCCGR